MKINWKTLSLLLLLGLALALSACTQPAPKTGGLTDTASKPQAIVGTWQSPEYVDMMGLENADTLVEVGHAEVGPELFGKDELRVGALE